MVDTLEPLATALREIEERCPCGARPESPDTHPHVIGCPVAAAIRASKQFARAYGELKRQHDELTRLIWAACISMGGQISVRLDDLGVVAGGNVRTYRAEDPVTKRIYLRAEVRPQSDTKPPAGDPRS